MRYDKSVEFVSRDPEKYNPDTGKLDNNEISIGIRRCAIYDLTSERMAQLFGRVSVKGMVIHHQGEVVPAELIRYEGKLFHIMSSRSMRNKASYIVTESRMV